MTFIILPYNEHMSQFVTWGSSKHGSGNEKGPPVSRQAMVTHRDGEVTVTLESWAGRRRGGCSAR
jgi:hypothetical protein